jgi:hypothetical protein
MSVNGRKGSRIRALVALAAVVIVLEVQPAEAHRPGPLSGSTSVQHLGNVRTAPTLLDIARHPNH